MNWTIKDVVFSVLLTLVFCYMFTCEGRLFRLEVNSTRHQFDLKRLEKLEECFTDLLDVLVREREESGST